MYKLRTVFLILIIFLSPCTKSYADFRGLPQINVLAPTSLVSPITEIIKEYAREKNITVTVSYDNSKDQAQKIVSGESADIFISSNPKFIKELKQNGLVDVYSLSNIAHNRLVLASSSRKKFSYHDNKENMEKILFDINKKTTLIIADPSDTSLGNYTEDALTMANPYIWNQIKQNALKIADSRTVLYMVEQGGGVGIIYASDAYNNNKISVIKEFDLTDSIFYQGAVVAGENMELARGLLDFIKSKKDIFQKYGFIIDV